MGTKKIFSVILTLGLLLQSILIAVPVHANSNNKVLLEWARSVESEEAAYLLDVNGGTWRYSEAVELTPLKYFQTVNVKADANDKADYSNEYVVLEDEQVVNSRIIWDGGQFFDKYKNENGNVSYEWASWEHFGRDGEPEDDKGEYSIRRFSTYLDLSADELSQMESAIIAPEDELGNMNYLFPINDTAFVFVNGNLAFWGGTDVVEGQNQYRALNRTSFMNKDGIKVRNGVNGILKDIYPHTDGWCIDLEQHKDIVDIKSMLKAGDNRIDIFVDDYWEGGGMNKLSLFTQAAAVIVPELPDPVAGYTTLKEVFLEDGITAVNKPVNPGTILTYKITVTSTGDAQTDNILVTDEIPAFTQYVENEGGVLNGNTVSWDEFKLAAVGEGTDELPESVTVEFKVQVQADAFSKTIDNAALVNNEVTNIVTVVTTDKTIDVEAITKGDVYKNISICLDMSMTMKDSSSITPAINGLKAMVNSIFANGRKATVNLITFNYKAHDLITVDETNYQELLDVITGLKPAMALNGTNMADALDKAYANLSAMSAAVSDSENFIVFIGDGIPHNSQQVTPKEEDGKIPTDYADIRNNYKDASGLYAVTDAFKAEGGKVFSIYYGSKLSDIPAGTEREKQRAGMVILQTMSSNTANDSDFYYNTNTGGQLQTAIANISADLNNWEAGRDFEVNAVDGIATIDISKGFTVSQSYPVIISVDDVETTFTTIEALPSYIEVDSDKIVVDINELGISSKIKISYYENIQ